MQRLGFVQVFMAQGIKGTVEQSEAMPQQDQNFHTDIDAETVLMQHSVPTSCMLRYIAR
jgi:hypothetical protein